MSNPADGARRQIPQSDAMTYIISTNGPGDEESFRKVGELVGDRPDGLIGLYGGASGAGLSITAIWETKAHSDRFAAEKLMPALQELGIAGGRPTTMIEFEAFTEVAGHPVSA
jgi:hypothetical protein